MATSQSFAPTTLSTVTTSVPISASAFMSSGTSTLDKFAPPPTSGVTAKCFWQGHCLGDPCKTYNDCDNDWICSNSVCVVCIENCGPGFASGLQPNPNPDASIRKSHRLPQAAVIAIAVIVTACLLGLVFTTSFIAMRRSKRRKTQAKAQRIGKGPPSPPLLPSMDQKVGFASLDVQHFKLSRSRDQRLYAENALVEMQAPVPSELEHSSGADGTVAPVEIDGASIHRRFSWQPQTPMDGANGGTFNEMKDAQRDKN